MVEIKDANIDIHVHPFLRQGWNSLESVLEAMGRKGLDIVALEAYNGNLFAHVIAESKKLYSSSELVIDDIGIIYPSNKVIFNAKEYGSREGFHLLTVGWENLGASGYAPLEDMIEVSLEHKPKPLVVLDHPLVDNGRTNSAGHITLESEDWLNNICRKYSGEIAAEWNGYCKPWIRAGLRLALNLMGHQTAYHDVNKKASQFVDSLRQEGYNLPLLADTDLHARSKFFLREMGSARFITDVEGDTPSDLLTSMRNNIFNHRYQNQYGYASSHHILMAYCFPILFPQVFFKPRA